MIRAIASIFAIAIASMALTGCPGALETGVRTANSMTQFHDGVVLMVREVYKEALKQAMEESKTAAELDDRIAAIDAKFKPIEEASQKCELALVALQQAVIMAQHSAEPLDEDKLYRLMADVVKTKAALGDAMRAAGLDPGDVSEVIPVGEN